MEEEEYELELFYTSPVYSDTVRSNKYIFEGDCVDDHKHNICKPVCEEQTSVISTRMVEVKRQKIRDRSKYMPHQGKKECERRVG